MLGNLTVLLGHRGALMLPSSTIFRGICSCRTSGSFVTKTEVITTEKRSGDGSTSRVFELPEGPVDDEFFSE